MVAFGEPVDQVDLLVVQAVGLDGPVSGGEVAVFGLDGVVFLQQDRSGNGELRAETLKDVVDQFLAELLGGSQPAEEVLRAGFPERRNLLLEEHVFPTESLFLVGQHSLQLV